MKVVEKNGMKHTLNKLLKEMLGIKNILQKKEHILTSEERELVKELLKINDSTLDTMSTYIFEDGDLCIRTPQHTWISLCGRE